MKKLYQSLKTLSSSLSISFCKNICFHWESFLFIHWKYKINPLKILIIILFLSHEFSNCHNSLNCHLNLTLTLTSNVKVTERSRKTSVGRQSDSIINSTAHHPTANFSDASRGPTPSVIPYWKPLMTPNLGPNSDATILHIFLQPFFANKLN